MGPSAPRWKAAAIVFALAAAAIALATVHQYGATWDEEHSMRQGDLTLRWYASAFHDRRVIDEGNYRFYGGFFNVLVQLIHRAGAPLYETSHLVTVLFGLASLPIAYWIGSTLLSPAAGFLSMVFLWLTPVYYGHAFNNPKDLPFAVLSLGAFAAIVSCWDHLPDPPARVWLRTGAVLGMTMAVRVAGLVTFGYLALSWIAWLALRGNGAEGASREPAWRSALRLLVAGAKIFVVAWAIMALFWPWAQDSPVHAPWRGLLASRRFGEWIATVRFEGSEVFSDKLPRTYLPIWFGVTLPEFYFLAALLSPIVLLRAAHARAAGAAGRRSAVFVALLAFTVCFPVASAIWSRSILYDGVRHLLFVVPPLAILAAMTVAAFTSHTRSRAVRAAVAAVCGISLAATAIDMWRLHPYESVYFNRSLGGGLDGAFGRFETDYWGESYKEGVEWLAASYDTSRTRPTRVANCSWPFLTAYYLDQGADRRARFEPVAMDGHPDVVLATTRWSCHEKIAGRVLHVVTRFHTPLCYVIEVDPMRFSPPSNLGQ